VHDVTLALLDQFEMRDQERRRQVVDILRELLPRLLVALDFSNVALIVNELQLLANKTGENETQELVTSLLRDMSEAMAEMVSTVDAEGVSPAAEELAALVGALQAEAIPTLVRAIPAVPNRQTRDRLTEALDRLVESNPGYVVDLLSAEDPMIAAEDARIVGRLGLTEAEPDLIELSRRPEDVTRQAAIEALAVLGSAVGAEALTTALSDPGKDIRMAAVNAIAAVHPEGAAALLGDMIGGSDLADRDQGEQMAFMRAYAMIAEDGAVSLFAKLLNGRKWWGGRRPSNLRACAARALGLIGSPAARSALEKATADRAAPVKSAVRVALRAIDSDSDEALGAAVLTEELVEEVIEDPLDLDMNIDLDAEDGEEETS
jgi:HEAT repeat protein